MAAVVAASAVVAPEDRLEGEVPRTEPLVVPAKSLAEFAAERRLADPQWKHLLQE